MFKIVHIPNHQRAFRAFLGNVDPLSLYKFTFIGRLLALASPC